MHQVQVLVFEKKAELDQLVDEIEAFHKDFSKRQEEEQQRQLKIRKTESEVQVSAVHCYFCVSVLARLVFVLVEFSESA